MIYSSVAEVVSFVPQEMCWSVLCASPQLLSSPSVDFKFITCLINSCRILFSCFGEGKGKEKRLTGETLQTEASQVRALAYMNRHYFCLLKDMRCGQACGIVSSSQR